MTKENWNFVWALVLSVAIVVGWQYFYIDPQLKNRAVPVSAGQEKPLASPGLPLSPDPSGALVPSVGSQPRSSSLPMASSQTSPRIQIETAHLSGSLSLKGAQIDTLFLKKYHETVDPKSSKISLLSPSGTEHAFFVEDGFVPLKGGDVPTSETIWTLYSGKILTEKTPIVLLWKNSQGIRFFREISVDDRAMFQSRQRIENPTKEPFSFYPYARVQRQGMPNVHDIYVIHEGFLGVLNGELHETTYKNLLKEEKDLSYPSLGGWLGFTDKYWAVALIPDQKRELTARFLHGKAEGRDIWQADYVGKTPVVVAPGATEEITSRFFAGAKVVETITHYAKELSIDRFDLLIDWGWFYFITKPMFHFLHFIQLWTGNFGIAILLATVVLKILFFPLANKSYQAMSQMKKLQPEIEKLKVRFGDDRVKLQEAMMEMYRKEKVNPVSGCLPMLVQIPVFFALYKVIYVTIEMRHAPFYGWIRDLSAPDPTTLFNLFGLLPWTPPHVLMIGVLPLLMGATMWIQMRLNPAPTDPIQATVFTWMPLLFTVMLAPFPAGLVLYWAWNNTLSILQQFFIMKRHGVSVHLFENIPFFSQKKKE